MSFSLINYKKNHTVTHELGHAIGDLVDLRNKKARSGYLMSYSDDGNGYNLRMTDYRDILDNLIYNRASSKLGIWGSMNDTKSDVEDLIHENVKQ